MGNNKFYLKRFVQFWRREMVCDIKKVGGVDRV